MRPIRFLLASLALLSINSLAAAQNYVPTQPDNTLTPADPIGIPPQPTGAGTHEAVSPINGGLSFFLPVLSLPQRGGWNLTLGYYNTSPHWHVRQDVSVMVSNQGGGLQSGIPPATSFTYSNNIKGYLDPAFRLNLPTLEASIEYTGDARLWFNGVHTVAYEVPVQCITNWVFTDWSGNKHPFSNVTICSTTASYGIYTGSSPAAFSLAQVTDSSDGSWLRLDTSNYNSDITVRTKDGTVYHFPGWLAGGDPFSGCNSSPSCFGNNQAVSTSPYNNPWYQATFSSIVDNTGQNTVTYSNGTLTDTIGRQITLGSGGITYKDSNGNTQTISLTGASGAQTNYNLGTFSCSEETNQPPPNSTITVNPAGPSSFTLPPITETIAFPLVNGVSRVYTLQFDGLGNLAQITYPEGGYTKYVLPNPNATSFWHQQGLVACQQPQQEVTQKRECPLSSGACSSSQELVTTYTPVVDLGAPFNDSMAVQDPLGNVTSVSIQNSDVHNSFVAPHETSRTITAPNGTLLRTIQTSYTTYEPGVDIQVPTSITTTLNDISPAISSVTNYQYQTVPITVHCINGGNCVLSGTQVVINNPTETDEYDYGNTTTPLKKTAQTWMTTSNGALYDIAGGHLLDRLSARTITDPATNVQSTLSYGYNSVGDITSKTIGGTSLTSLVTNYQRDAYGNITQVTDPKGNITHFGYTDTWAQTTCAPGSNSSAYLTSITDALNHITNFSYNSCTGSKASATDPNNARTSFSYDALGRATSVNYPDDLPPGSARSIIRHWNLLTA